jgi:hypothetical protein
MISLGPYLFISVYTAPFRVNAPKEAIARRLTNKYRVMAFKTVQSNLMHLCRALKGITVAKTPKNFPVLTDLRVSFTVQRGPLFPLCVKQALTAVNLIPLQHARLVNTVKNPRKPRQIVQRDFTAHRQPRRNHVKRECTARREVLNLRSVHSVSSVLRMPSLHLVTV